MIFKAYEDMEKEKEIYFTLIETGDGLQLEYVYMRTSLKIWEWP